MSHIALSNRPQDLVLFVDMDATIADYYAGVEQAIVSTTGKSVAPDFWTKIESRDTYARDLKSSVDRVSGFYATLPPIPGAVETLKELDRLGFTIFFLSTPDARSTSCHSDKNVWISAAFGADWCTRLILTHDKTLVGVHGKRNILIDDNTKLTGHNKTPLWTQILKQTPYNQWEKDAIKGRFPHMLSEWSLSNVLTLL